MSFNKQKALERAERFAAKGQHDRAAKEYQTVVDEDPKDIRAWLMLADCLVRSGQPIKAIERYVQVGNHYLQNGDAKKAMAVFRQVLQLDANRFDVHLKMAQVYRNLGHIADSVASYEFVAHAQLKAGKAHEAMQNYRAAADADPTAVARRLRLAELYSREKMNAEAVEAFRVAGDLLLGAGRREEYLRVAERLLFHRADDTGTLRTIARTYLAEAEPRRALMKLNALLQTQPTDAEGLELLGETFVALDKPDKAASVMAELARELLGRGEEGGLEAVRVIRRGLEWHPRDEKLREMLRELGTGLEEQSGRAAAARTESTTGPSPLELGMDDDGDDAEELELGEGDVEELDDDDVISDEFADFAPSDPEPDLDQRVAAAPVGTPSPRRHDETPLTSSVLSEVEDRSTGVVLRTGAETDADRLVGEARVYVKYKLYEHALEHMQEIFADDPSHVDALEVSAMALEGLERLPAAADAHAKVARAVLRFDRDRAQRAAEAAVALNSGQAEAREILRTLAGDRAETIEPAANLEPVDHHGDDDPFAFDMDDDDAAPVATPDEHDFAIDLHEPKVESPVPVEREIENRFGLSDVSSLPQADRAGESLVRSALDDVEPLDEPLDEPAEEATVVRAAPPAPEPVDWPDLSDDLSEIEFYLDQKLMDDARSALDDLKDRHPGHPGLEAFERERMAPATAAPLSVTRRPPAEAKPLVDLDDEEDEDGDYLSAIFSDGSDRKSAQPARARAEVDAGVDAETHFDLGTAYREMGLVDDAIREFEAVARDPAWRARALVMLATLRIHRGESDRATAELLEAIGIASNADELSGARYELAVVYETAGNVAAAAAELEQVPRGFRDRDERLQKLRP